MNAQPDVSSGRAERSEWEAARSGYPTGFPADIAVPAARYVDKAFHELEQDRVFAAGWLFAAHGGQIPLVGDVLLLDAFAAMGHPIFLLRGKDGKVRAFYNACQHRGAPLVAAGQTHVDSRMICGYHAWTYDLEGQLIGFPEAKNFPPDHRKGCLGLKTVECDTWGQLIFVRLRGEGPSLRKHLEPVASELDELLGETAEAVHFVESRSLALNCNWKMPVDANIETYHVPFVHRRSAAQFLDEQRTAQWLLPNGHSGMLIGFRQPSDPAVRGFVDRHGNTRLGVYSFHIFPNMSIVFGGPAHCFLIMSLPAGPGTSIYSAHFLSAADPRGEHASSISKWVEANWGILLEDLAQLEAAQQAIGSGAIETLRLQYQERRIRYLHEEIDRRIGEEHLPEALRVPPLMDRYVEFT